VLRTLPDNSVDAIVTDPPYGLSAHPPAEVVACLRAWLDGVAYTPKSVGFMSATWDAWVPGPEVWREALRVLKPGGHCLAFAGTRSMDLMGLALRLAGFELRDSLSWIYGSGFPKSLNVSKAIDREAGAEREIVGYNDISRRNHPEKLKERRDGLGSMCGKGAVRDREFAAAITAPATDDARAWEGWGTAIKPAIEPILMARKPLVGTVAANVIAHGVGALHVDACRVPTAPADAAAMARCNTPGSGQFNTHGAPNGGACYGAFAARTEAFDVDRGRYPANVILDGSPAVAAGFPEQKSGANPTRRHANIFKYTYSTFVGDKTCTPARGADAGSAARFFPTCPPGPDDLPFMYCAKAGRSERAKNAEGVGHTTVKPVALMRWLVRLVAPVGALICDPFMGSGSTGVAARAEGMAFLGIEREPAYLALAASRLPGATVEPAPDAAQLEKDQPLS
jgi:site-specific DNA-methyltransferase (adenine-specific)